MKIKNLALILMACAALVSCGASKKAVKPVETYVQPGYELLNVKNTIRAWAVGVSDSEMTAKKKAMADASSQLAQILQKTVSSTIEKYCVSLSESEAAKSKEFFNEKITIVSKAVLQGAVPIFDEWEAKGADGMYRNYIVLELSKDKFINKLIEEMGKTDVRIDEKLLNELFLKAINEKE